MRHRQRRLRVVSGGASVAAVLRVYSTGTGGTEEEKRKKEGKGKEKEKGERSGLKPELGTTRTHGCESYQKFFQFFFVGTSRTDRERIAASFLSFVFLSLTKVYQYTDIYINSYVLNIIFPKHS